MVEEGIDSDDKDLEVVEGTTDEVRAGEEVDVQGGSEETEGRPAEGVYGGVRGVLAVGGKLIVKELRELVDVLDKSKGMDNEVEEVGARLLELREVLEVSLAASAEERFSVWTEWELFVVWDFIFCDF